MKETIKEAEVIYDAMQHTSRWMSAADMVMEAWLLGLDPKKATHRDLQNELKRRHLHTHPLGRVTKGGKA